ncbi:MAG: PLP-dependent aminotransferase family protein [Fuerstiella sp.]
MTDTRESVLSSAMAQRAAEQAIGFLMQQGIENADCLSLAAGFVDPATLPVDLVRQAADRLLSDTASARSALQYGTTPGSEELRSVFRSYLADLEENRSRVEAVPLDQFMLTTGSQQLLALLTQALFNEGDICLVAAPTYFVYLGVLDAVGADVIPVKTDEDGMCPEDLNLQLQRLSEEDQLDRVKLVYVVSYHDNPAGITVSAARRPRLVDVCRQWSIHRPIYLLEDAAYRELHYDGPKLPSIWSCDTGYDEPQQQNQQHVILAQTFSKSFSPGLRVGLSILPPELVKPVSDLKGNEDFGSGHLSQNILAQVLSGQQYHSHVNGLCRSYTRKRDAMLSAADEFFSLLDGVSWRRPHGGLYVWMTLPPHIETGFDSPLFQRATEVDKVMYVPGELCYPSQWTDRPRNQMRLSFGVLGETEIREGMKRLASAVSAVMAE